MSFDDLPHLKKFLEDYYDINFEEMYSWESKQSQKETFADEVREKMSVYYGQRIEFYYLYYRRLKGYKYKKVSGKFRYIGHNPKDGWFIELYSIRAFGQYFGSVRYKYDLLRIRDWRRLFPQQTIQ